MASMIMSGYFAIKQPCPNFSFRKSYRFPYRISCRCMARKCHVNVAFSCLSGTFSAVFQQHFLKISLYTPRFHHILTAVLSPRHRDDSGKTSRRLGRDIPTTNPRPRDNPLFPIRRTEYLHGRSVLAANTRFSKGGLSAFLSTLRIFVHELVSMILIARTKKGW